MEFDLKAVAALDSYKLMTGLVVPRPIAFVSTLSADGARNAAPFSFFNMFGVNPVVIVLGINARGAAHKDSFANICATGEFVVNVATDALAEKLNAASADVAADVDEFLLAGLTAAASVAVAAPRIAESPAHLECRLMQTVAIDARKTLVVGEVVHVHVRDDLVDGYKVDQRALDLIGRMGGPLYTRTRDLFAMERPVV